MIKQHKKLKQNIEKINQKTIIKDTHKKNNPQLKKRNKIYLLIKNLKI